MIRRTKTKKTIIKKTNPAGLKLSRKEMRFSVSLVILIGMLTFSSMLLLCSLNKSVARSPEAEARKITPVKKDSEIKKAKEQVLNDALLDFRVTAPAGIGEWFYKIGEVKSPVDDSLSDQYLKIYISLPSTKSNNFDQQNKDILTIRKFSTDEWADITKSCQKEKKEICDAAGELIKETSDSKGEDWVYAFTKPTDCPKSIEAECSLADKIVQSFQLK